MGKKNQHRPRRSGDPRKREQAQRMSEPLPLGETYAQPFTHVCGCRLSWSSARYINAPAAHVIARLHGWLRGVSHLPCPMHGSVTGDPSPPLAPGARRVMAGDEVSYMLCPEDRYEAADHMGELLRSESDPRRQLALKAIFQEDRRQAEHAERMRWSVAGGDERACFICGDTEDTDWYRWTDSTLESLICLDCAKIQHDMFSEGSGDHLVKVIRKTTI